MGKSFRRGLWIGPIGSSGKEKARVSSLCAPDQTPEESWILYRPRATMVQRDPNASEAHERGAAPGSQARTRLSLA